MPVITRFAPSPTGFLHIGGARTALFNWLYARHFGGTFLLRIEDTDRARSTQAAVDAILDGLQWLGLDWDEPPIFQFARAGRHAEIARSLLACGGAYYCYCTPEELEAMRNEQRAKGLPIRYDGRWRDRDPADAPPGVAPTIRLKAPKDGETIVEDKVQGPVRVANSEIDDMVLLRADGTPTYMLSVVVDDHDMAITHVIRGSDHLTNTFRQIQIYRACGWDVPIFGHIPLIHGADGAKLSKRHGALGAEAYRDLGFLPEALRNYLLRLGWSHGDDEIISTEQAIAWFDLDSVGQAPARFDLNKLTSVNGHYMRIAEPHRLAVLIAPRIQQLAGRELGEADIAVLVRGMAGLQERAKTLIELAEAAAFYVTPRPIPLDDKAKKLLDGQGLDLVGAFRANVLAAVQNWRQDVLEESARVYVESRGVGLGKLAQPIRAALTGSATSPPIFEVMEVLGREECLARIDDVLERNRPSGATTDRS